MIEVSFTSLCKELRIGNIIHDDDDGDERPCHRPVQQTSIIKYDENDDDDSFHRSVK